MYQKACRENQTLEPGPRLSWTGLLGSPPQNNGPKGSNWMMIWQVRLFSTRVTWRTEVQGWFPIYHLQETDGNSDAAGSFEKHRTSMRPKRASLKKRQRSPENKTSAGVGFPDGCPGRGMIFIVHLGHECLQMDVSK